MERKIAVPIDVIWEWARDVRTVASAISRVEVLDERGQEELLIRPNILRGFLSLPDELRIGETVLAERNDSEKHVMAVTENEGYRFETSLDLEEVSESKTKTKVKVRAELKEISGKVLEKFIFFPVISNIVLQKRVSEILDKLLIDLENYMRKRWREKISDRIRDLDYTKKGELNS